ncbi:hypothetical protein [Raineyella sp. LH-20]|uniref:hypothetical protein n=1 Tax=Raineyella sp. LH-20 TaxID=3081204 RepID=UPI0029535D8B|nr:hypothetical protein [Raineyella sp. LH-20]WOP18758.1 hypothetical protein R0146_00320 [Raineyella sp. LH-20]
MTSPTSAPPGAPATPATGAAAPSGSGTPSSPRTPTYPADPSGPATGIGATIAAAASPTRPARTPSSPSPAPVTPSLTETGITAAITAEQQLWSPHGGEGGAPASAGSPPGVGSPTTRSYDTTGLTPVSRTDTTGLTPVSRTDTTGLTPVSRADTTGLTPVSPAAAADQSPSSPSTAGFSPSRAAEGPAIPPGGAAPGGADNPPSPPRGKGPSRAMDDGGGRGWSSPRTLLIGAVAAVLVVGVIVTTVLFRDRTHGPVATGTPTSSESQVLSADALLTTDDAKRLDDKVAWTETLTQGRVDANTPKPNCLTTDAEGVPLPVATMVRAIQGGDANTNLLNEAFQFNSAKDATTAATIWTTQLGACERPVSYLEGGWTVSNVGDASVGVSAVVQDKTSVHHTVMLSRSGSVITVVDASRPDNTPDGAVVAGLLGTAVGRTCQAAGGACTTDAQATSGVPPKTATDPQFLANADLPRITAGTGRWGGTDVATSFDFFGSQCEGKDLATVGGPTDRKHRAYLLQEDASAPQTFGVDEYILTFPDRASADSLVKDVSGSIDGCDKAMLTAKIEKTDDLSAKGAADKAITGRTWVVTQQVNQTTKQKYRLALAQVDNSVIYLMVPTGDTFDFNNAQWKAIGERAGSRLSSTL